MNIHIHEHAAKNLRNLHTHCTIEITTTDVKCEIIYDTLNNRMLKTYIIYLT